MRTLGDRSLIPVFGKPGSLYQGGAPRPGMGELLGFDLVVNCSYELPNLSHELDGAGTYLHVKLDDGQTVKANDVRRAAGAVRREVEDGRRVLVHCTQGWNRSGLVVASALMRLGMTAGDAIAQVKRDRHPRALSNPYFILYLMYGTTNIEQLDDEQVAAAVLVAGEGAW